MCIADKKLFIIQGDSKDFLNWEEYGLRISVPSGTLSSKEICEISVTVLVGGKFQFPEGTELISAVYLISLSKSLLKPVKFEIQHCAHLVTEDHTRYLSFVSADVNQPVLPYQFQLQEGGEFHPGNQYGSIYIPHFCLKAIVKSRTDPISTINNNQSAITSQGMNYITNTEYNSLLYIAVGSSSPDKKYVAQVVYEVKGHNREWLMRLMAAKCLNALLKVMSILKLSIINVSNSTLKIHFHQTLRQMLIFPSHLKILMVTLN